MSELPRPISTDLVSSLESTAEALRGSENDQLRGLLIDAAEQLRRSVDVLASLKEMGDWIAAGLQASDEAWPDAKCLQHTEEIAARARAAVDKAEGRS